LTASAEAALDTLATAVGAGLRRRGLVLATAESCTGGWVAQVVTRVPGSSEWFDRGFVTYSNPAKCEMLGVSEQTLVRHGAVSEETVREMAVGALARSRADVSVAVSGIAGPSGGSPDKPVGTVWLAWTARSGEVRTRLLRLAGERTAIREQSVIAALQGVLDLIER
jgi:nicotinamide-nucleotide amidase